MAMESLQRKLGCAPKRVSWADKSLLLKTECAQKPMGPIGGVLKKRRLENTQEDFDASMAMKPVKIKLCCTKKRESCADMSLLRKTECAQKPMGSVGGVLKKRKLERAQKDFDTSMETKSLKIRVGFTKKRKSWDDKSLLPRTECAQKTMGSAVGGGLKKRRLDRTKKELKGNTETPMETTECQADLKRVMSDCAQKPMGLGVGGVLKKRRLESTQEKEKGNAETPLKSTEFHADAKRVLSDWRKIKRERQREAARLELEQIKNTAGFMDSMEAMIEFEQICGCAVSYPIYTSQSCFDGSTTI